MDEAPQIGVGMVRIEIWQRGVGVVLEPDILLQSSFRHLLVETGSPFVKCDFLDDRQVFPANSYPADRFRNLPHGVKGSSERSRHPG